MDIIIPDIKTYEDFSKGGDICANALVMATHEEYNEIMEGCDVKVFFKTNTGTDFIRGKILRNEGPVPTTLNDKHLGFRLLIRKF
jgi:hypothetical protein